MAISKEKLISVSNALELLRNTLKCAICLDFLREPVTTRCDHHFCNLCITNLLAHKKNGRTSCPLCNSAVNRRSLQANGKIKHLVENIVQLVKAVEADSQVDILHLKEVPCSTNEANSPDPAPAASAGSRRKEIQHVKDLKSKAVDTVTPERSSPQRISSAEKVQSWLLQNKEDFEHKGILNSCTDTSENPVPIEEDCDVDMVSVSQVVNESHIGIDGQNRADVSNIKNPKSKPVRRILNVKQVSKAASSRLKSDEAFDKLLKEHNALEEKASKSSGRLDNSTMLGFKGSSSDKKNHADSKMGTSKNIDLEVDVGLVDTDAHVEPIKKVHQPKHADKIISVCLERIPNADGKLGSQCNPNSYVGEPSRKLSIMSKKLDSGIEAQQPPSDVQSVVSDSCEIIPPSVVAVQAAPTRTPIHRRSIANRGSERTRDRSESKKDSIAASKGRITKPPNRKEPKNAGRSISSRTNAGSNASSVAFVKAGRFCQSGRNNVQFIQRGRLLRERRYIPVDVRYYFCADKTVLMIDTNESHAPEVRSEPTRDWTPAAPSRKEYCSLSVRTSPRGAAEGTEGAQVVEAVCQAEDDDSQDLFPQSPQKVDSGAGGIYKRQINDGMSAVNDAIIDAETVILTQQPINDAIMDAETVILTQQPAVPSSVAHSGPRLQPISEPCATVITESDNEEDAHGLAQPARSNLSESLLSRGGEVARKSGSEEDDDFPRVKKRRRTVMRSRKLSSSEESDSGVRKVRKKEQSKKNSTEPEKISCPDVKDLLPGLFDETLESPKRLVRGIKAKIEADMQGKLSGNDSRRCSPRTKKSAKSSDIDLCTPPKKRVATYSDHSDIDFLEGTPQPSMDTTRRSRKSARSSEKMSAPSARKSLTPAEQTMDDPVVRDSLSPDFVESTPQILPPTQTRTQDLDVSVRDTVQASEEDSLLHCSILEQTRRDATDISQPKRNRYDDTNFAKPASVSKKPAATPQRPLREINVASASPRSNRKPACTDVQRNACPQAEIILAENNPSKSNNSTRSEVAPLENPVGNNSPRHLNVKQGPPSFVPSPARNSSQAVTTKTPPKLSFLCSGLGGDLPFQVKKFAEKVGAGFSTTFDPKVTTHLIVRTKDNGTTDKTLKYLQAVAAKKWVVSIRWIQEGAKQGKLLPEENFEALDTSGVDGPRRSRLSTKALFADFEFCCFPPFSDLTKEQLEELIELCGGTVVSDSKQFSFKPDVLPLCLAQWDDEREQEYAGWMDRHCVPLVQHDWLMDCIGRFSIISFWSLLMSDVADENLLTMGYRPELLEHPPSDSTEMD